MPLPAGAPGGSRYVTISVYDEFGVPFDIGWLLRHADLHAENELFDNLVSPNVEVFRKDPAHGKTTRHDIIDIRDEYGLPYRNHDFRILSEAEFPALTSVFDKDAADLLLENPNQTTGASGVWAGPQVNAGNNVVIQGVGVKDHLLAFLPSCASSSVLIKMTRLSRRLLSPDRLSASQMVSGAAKRATGARAQTLSPRLSCHYLY